MDRSNPSGKPKVPGEQSEQILYGDFASGRPAPPTLAERLRHLDLSDLSSPYHFQDLHGFSGTDSWGSKSRFLPDCLKAQLGPEVSPGASGDMPGAMMIEGTWARLQQIAESGPLEAQLSAISFQRDADDSLDEVIPSIIVYAPVGFIPHTLRLAIEELSEQPGEGWWLYRGDRRSIYYSDGEQILGWFHQQ